MHRGVPRRLHLRGQPDALHPPRRVRRLWRLRAGLSGRGHLLRGRHPGQWKDYYKANVEFFDDLGSPGGASKGGKIDKDHPLVAALPPMAKDEHEVTGQHAH